MKQTLPGTTIEADLSRSGAAAPLLDPLFLTGGLMLSQVARLTGLEPYVIQNWVRRGFVSPPQRKRYSYRQFCRIAMIYMLKDALQLDRICALLSYVNGQLDDESDDLIDDVQLYHYLVDLAVRARAQPAQVENYLEQWCVQVLEDYAEPVPGARRRVEQVLCAAVMAYLAGLLRHRAEELCAALDTHCTDKEEGTL